MGAKILVVEDMEIVRRLIHLHLTQAGYEVQLAEDPVVAGHMVVKDPPDLIITDVRMPYMDGFEFVAALKSDPAYARIPVLFLTSQSEGDSRAKALGAVGFINKPIRADHLLDAVARHVPAPSGKMPVGG